MTVYDCDEDLTREAQEAALGHLGGLLAMMRGEFVDRTTRLLEIAAGVWIAAGVLAVIYSLWRLCLPPN